MATYVLIHGAGSDSWYWHRVVPELERLGHTVVAPDLPSEDESAGFGDYADAVVEAIGARSNLIVVGQSLAGYTAPLVCTRLPVDLLVLVAAMVPRPGESGHAWWASTGQADAQREEDERNGRPTDGSFDIETMFFHDVPADVTAAAFQRGVRHQSSTPMREPWPLEAWPDVETRFLLCRDDRLFPAAFLRRVVRERLGITPDEMDAGHLPALSRPRELIDHLEALRRGVRRPSSRAS